MSRYAPVCPLPVAEALWTMKLLGDYHLLLAHDVLEEGNQDQYHDLYSTRIRSKSNDAIVIMDNSLVEIGVALPFEQVSLAAQICDADYIVAADIFLEAGKTIRAAQDFTTDALTAKRDGQYVPGLMGVVQGRTIRECLAVADFYASEPIFTGIAVPRCLTAVLGSRIPVLLELYKRYALRFNCWHLLGLSDDIFDDMASARLPFVSGIDSAAPLRGALRNIRFDLPYTDFGPRGDFWKTGNLPAAAHACMRHNINTIQSLIEIHPQ